MTQSHLVMVQLAGGGDQVLQHDGGRVVAQRESLGLEVTEAELGYIFAHLVDRLDEGSVKNL